ncbi:conserved hypothetical protein [Uncinocarpus reesii 1704]|uniref:DUF803 domain membrane protein n=1 Tax=Uncinocarpus reesii (strain UAMH 1704) TaxID=336963 RepID=C4JN82_UNCRE|nr:uncharacterized protein UREG_04288 [Uncinocarpus reesii 1704]EEP79442.1 conserved hypothetical protein [Uncinocarpus reesii 1704]
MWFTLLFSLFVNRSLSNASLPLSLTLREGTRPGDDDGGSPISEWSSTIGIVTAIVGNVLISFALNIQRYAHIRIARDQERKRIERGWKIGNPDLRDVHGEGGQSAGTYGAVSQRAGSFGVQDNIDRRVDDVADIRPEIHDQNACRRQIPTARQSSDGPVSGHTDTDDSDDDGTDRLKQSFLSERTVTSLEKSSKSKERKSYLRSPYWWTGIILMTIGEAGNFLAYGFAPASIVSPLGVVALVSNCVIAPIMLKERFRQQDFWGVLVAIAGAVTVVLSANTSEEKIGPDDIIGMITRWEFELYLGLTVGLILILMWFSKEHGRKTILIDLGLVGLFGGYTALATKGVSSLLSYTLWHVITFPITYALAAVLIVTAMMQIRYINRALQRFDSTQVIPTQFVLFTISVIVGSAILYRDFESLTLKQGLQFFGGCALTFLGVYLITSGRSQGERGPESEQDEEEAIGLLQGTPYRDSLDWHDQSDNRAVPRVEQALPTEEDRQSRCESLLSEHDLQDDDEDTLRTPRAQLSSSPASVPPSISDTSLLEPPEASPELHVASRWTPHREEFARTVSADARPGTPPPRSSVILQFPTAPGATESPLDTRLIATPKSDANRVRPRRHTISRTPRSPSRNRLSLRFSPGPLLPPLSGGLSAVVAESLRRGEGSPKKYQRRKRIISTPDGRASAVDGHADHDVEYESETGFFGDLGNRHHQPYGDELNRASTLGPPVTFRLPLAPNDQDNIASTPPERNDESPSHRGHGRKDSWTDNITRFSASLLESGRRWGRMLKDDGHGQDSPSVETDENDQGRSNQSTVQRPSL